MGLYFSGYTLINVLEVMVGRICRLLVLIRACVISCYKFYNLMP